MDTPEYITKTLLKLNRFFSDKNVLFEVLTEKDFGYQHVMDEVVNYKLTPPLSEDDVVIIGLDIDLTILVVHVVSTGFYVIFSRFNEIEITDGFYDLEDACFEAYHEYEKILYEQAKELYKSMPKEEGLNDKVFNEIIYGNHDVNSFLDVRKRVSHNPYQGNAQKILCVCSAGLLRSPTLAEYLRDAYGFNVRSAGITPEYALVLVDEVLMEWADDVVCVHPKISKAVISKFPQYESKVKTLNIKDEYPFRSALLVDEISRQTKEIFG